MVRARTAAALGVVVALAVGMLTPAHASLPALDSKKNGVQLVAAAASWQPKQGAVFNVPRSFDKRQWRIERRILGAIKHARKGSTIRMSMYSFDRAVIGNALIRARKRGVRVQVLLNNHEWPKIQGKMKRAIGHDRWKKNFVYSCKRALSRPKSEGSCRGKGDVLHTKFILFSHTGKARNVVMLGSVNMKLNGHRNQYNDLWSKNNAGGIHRFFVSVFNSMRKDRPVGKPYRTKSWPPRWRAEIFPYKGAHKRDPQMMALKPVKCMRSSITNEGGRTEVRVNMHAWDGARGARIAKRLRSLYAQGCDVKVQYGLAGRKVRQVLADPTRRGRVPVRTSGFDTTGDGVIDLYSHQKMLSIKGGYYKKRAYRGVWTGSPNYQPPGRFGDELLFRINSKRALKQYTNNWRWMWQYKTRKLRSSASAASFNIAVGRVMLEPPILVDPLSDNSIGTVGQEG